MSVVFTEVKLGSGVDATVYEVDWNGTLCAAKRLHEILLEDQSASEVAKFYCDVCTIHIGQELTL